MVGRGDAVNGAETGTDRHGVRTGSTPRDEWHDNHARSTSARRLPTWGSVGERQRHIEGRGWHLRRDGLYRIVRPAMTNGLGSWTPAGAAGTQRLSRLMLIAGLLLALTTVLVGLVVVAPLFGLLADNWTARHGTPTIRLDMTAQLVGRQLAVTGTDLPDGAVLWVQADNEDFVTAPPVAPVGPYGNQALALVRVANGSYSATLDLSAWPPGQALVDVTFAPDSSQPAPVVARFGAEGAGLVGPDVFVSSSDESRYDDVGTEIVVP